MQLFLLGAAVGVGSGPQSAVCDEQGRTGGFVMVASLCFLFPGCLPGEGQEESACTCLLGRGGEVGSGQGENEISPGS